MKTFETSEGFWEKHKISHSRRPEDLGQSDHDELVNMSLLKTGSGLMQEQKQGQINTLLFI